MAQVTITTTAMGMRVPIDKRGMVIGSSLNIGEFVKRYGHYQFDKITNRWIQLNEFFHFDSDNEMCYFPKYDLEDLKAFFDKNAVTYDVVKLPPVEGKHISFMMLPFVTFKNEKQKGCYEFLIDPKVGPIRGVALQTGSGKTVSVFMGIQGLGRRSLITMTSRLEQWVAELGKYTTLDEDDIYVIQGVGSLTKLFSQIDKGLTPKIILGSTSTMRRYLEYGPTYQHLPHPSLMCEKLNIGIVGTDEFHEHFYTNFLMGIILNPDIFMPITATFIANDPFVKTIFDKFIPKNIQFEGGDYVKFVNVTAYQYTSAGHLLKPYNYMSPQGYSQQMFEKFLLSVKGRRVLDALVEDAILPIIRIHYTSIAEKGEKLLFLCSSTKLCDHLEGILKRTFKDKTVSVFYSGMPVNILEKYDIILSTPGSAGTGRDVKNLRTCFAFESTGSETRNLQFIGRLRGPPQMLNTPEYVYLSLSAIPQHVKYHGARSVLYGPRALTFKHRTIS